MKDLSIYVHIPFCKQKCYYCNFVSFVNKCNTFDEYIDKMCIEIRKESTKYKDRNVVSIFIGGGTPSLINQSLIQKIMNELKNDYSFDKNIEISIESNPESLTIEKLTAYFEAGINRLSIGVQSLNNDLLKKINRPHNDIQALKAIDMAKKVGYKNINVDLMLGLPTQTKKDVRETIELIMNTNIVHISMYSLILEDKTVLSSLIKNNKLTLPAENETADMFEMARQLLVKNGYERYEVANFSKKGYNCNHNLGYWLGRDFVGFGIAAYSKIGKLEYSNTDKLNEYLAGNIISSSETVTEEENLEEEIMLSLRTSKGLNRAVIKNNDKLLIELENKGLIKLTKNRIIATTRGFEVLNKLILELVEEI